MCASCVKTNNQKWKFEYISNCISSRIFAHNSLLSWHRIVWEQANKQQEQQHKTLSGWHFCRQNRLVDERGVMRMAREVLSDRKSIVTPITTLLSRKASRCPIYWAWRRIGYNSRHIRFYSFQLRTAICHRRCHLSLKHYSTVILFFA